MNYIAANTQKSSWSNDFWICRQKKDKEKKKNQNIHLYIILYVEASSPKSKLFIIFDSHSRSVVFNQTSSQSFHHLKTVELQFQGKQYIYLPITLVEITDLATKISIPLALKISNIKSSHKRIQGTDKEAFLMSSKCYSSAMHFINQELPLYLKGKRAMREIPRQV